METSQVASKDAIEDFNANLSAPIRRCRTRGHSMAEHWAGLADGGDGYTQILRCSRCNTKRIEDLDSEANIIGVKYEYPEGYTLPPGTGRISSEGRSVFRLTMLRAKIESQTASQERRQAQNRKKKSA